MKNNYRPKGSSYNKSLKSFLIISITVTFLLLNFSVIQASSTETEPTIEIENIFVPFNGVGYGCILLTDAYYVGSLQLSLSWDPSLVSLASIDDSVSSFETVYDYIDSINGILNLTAYSKSNLTGDELTVACLYFERSGSTTGGETTSLDFSNTFVFDATPYGESITHSVRGGSLEIEKKSSGSSNPSNGNDYYYKANKEPIAQFTISDTVAFIDESILFDASDSYDSNNDPLSYSWDFGDGKTSTDEITSHSYDSAKTYTVSLTVNDGQGAKSTATKIIEILIPNIPPSKPTITGPSEGAKNTEYRYEIMSFDEDNDTIKYFVEWGDGDEENTLFLAQGESILFKHTWQKPGKYDIRVYSNDGKTNSNSARSTILIDAKLVGDIGYLIDEGGDGIYDSCFIYELEAATVVKLSDDGTYLIDEDNDGEWDYTFSTLTDALDVFEDNEEIEKSGINVQMVLLIAGFILIVSFVLAIYFKMKHKKAGV